MQQGKVNLKNVADDVIDLTGGPCATAVAQRFLWEVLRWHGASCGERWLGCDALAVIGPDLSGGHPHFSLARPPALQRRWPSRASTSGTESRSTRRWCVTAWLLAAHGCLQSRLQRSLLCGGSLCRHQSCLSGSRVLLGCRLSRMLSMLQALRPGLCLFHFALRPCSLPPSDLSLVLACPVNCSALATRAASCKCCTT